MRKRSAGIAAAKTEIACQVVNTLAYATAAKGAWDDKKEEAWKAHCDEWMDDEVNAYLETKPQPVTAMFDYMFAELPADLAKQRAAMLAREAQ